MLEFPELPHRKSSDASFTNFDNLQVEMEFSSKDAIIFVVKQHNIKNGFNFQVKKSWSNKYLVKHIKCDSGCF